MSLDRPILIGAAAEPGKRVEICRSFSYKMNLANYGGPQYESVDLFASRKMECAAEAADWISQQIFEECVAEVRAGVAAVAAEIKRKRALSAGNARGEVA